MRLIEKSITLGVYDALNESANYLKKYTNKTDKWKEVQERLEQECVDEFNGKLDESAELTAEVVYHGEDGVCDFTAGKLSDGRYFLIGQQEQIVVSDKDLPSLAKKDIEDFSYDEDGDKEFTIAIENGTTLDKNSDLAKIIINASRKYLEDDCYLLSESYVEEEVKNRKKVTKVEVTILPEVKFVWAEGSQDIVKSFFGSAEEHTMKFSDFQSSIYAYDSFIADRGGYNKVKYVANINAVFTYEDGSTNEEVTTYTGRLDCGDGYEYVTITKNMKYFIRGEFKDADIIVNEETTGTKESATYRVDESNINESEEAGKMTMAEYALKVKGGEFSSDVSDTEIDMMVYYYCDFKEEPRDNYERLIRYIGEHTYIDKVNSDVVRCDFTSLVKPYNEQWKEMFDMDYSEFDEEEAYYECVVNLEPIIAGNVGEKFCGEMLDIFEGRK